MRFNRQAAPANALAILAAVGLAAGAAAIAVPALARTSHAASQLSTAAVSCSALTGS